MILYFANISIFFSQIFILEIVNTLPCPLSKEQSIFAHRGGDISKFHENTVDIFLDAASRGYGLEMDLMQLGSGEIVVYHDNNFKNKVGVNLDLIKSTWNQVKEYSYLDQYSGRSYKTKSKIPLLTSVLQEVCSFNNKIGLWFDIKTFLNTFYAKSLVKALEASPCACNDKQVIIIEIYDYPYQIEILKKLFAKSRCNFFSAFGYFKYHAKLSHSELSQKFDKIIPYADFIDGHYSMWEKHPNLLSKLNMAGICSSVYGEGEDFKTFIERKDISLIIADVHFNSGSLSNPLYFNFFLLLLIYYHLFLF